MNISEHVFLVTGGASGLGAATARRLVADGGRVVLADVQDEAGAQLAEELGPKARFVHCDVTREADAQAAVDAARTGFGGLHGLVNCAGVVTPGKTLGREGPHDLGQFNSVVQINLVGTFNMIRLAAAVMAENEANEEGERGVVINTASVAAYEGQIGQAAYAASKAGVVGMTLPIAREFARHGIRVMSIAPGIFETPMILGMPQEVQDSLGASIPFPSRLGRPAEYAQLVASIVGNPMLNGETIRLDGAIRMEPK
jgi:NAD(P)-dependent dehydrogenase (short-subunit alcohol dehydrogenase family)